MSRPKSGRYCVIGAGAAGLAAAKSILDVGCDQLVVYEQTDQVGGTWVYTDTVGSDHHGLPIHGSMYSGLWTNLPKEVMGFPGYEMPTQRRSYIHSSEVLEFMKSYAGNYHVVDYVKFEHLVEQVKPVGEGKWEVIVKDLKNNESTTNTFDYVLVCNGHYFDPAIPNFPGKDVFKGAQLHSHEYRKPDIFRDRSVLIVGSGPSGKDLTIAASRQAQTVFFSHHVHEKLKNVAFPSNVVHVQDIAKLHESEVEFIDGTRHAIDLILYCTGYRYSFPFLHRDCAIEVADNWVNPLYKHILNINHPTMAFIGIPYRVCTTIMFDLQSRFAVKYYSGGKSLPSKEEMLADLQADTENRQKRGLSSRQAHMMGGEVQAVYYEDVARTADVTPVPPIMARMHMHSERRRNEDLLKYRNDVFRVLDDNNFEVEYDESLDNRGE
ncbi:senecionine N-oxygenase-like [Culex pipiens pallens]|uniref:senecionine N-oxygenase-like n=1 Tax=Culex pipiens pallens TaxID=42434 RepID=UPI001952EB96|nr:senecionine N-oxygenase-like [Culex pipiens pallens]